MNKVEEQIDQILIDNRVTCDDYDKTGAECAKVAEDVAIAFMRWFDSMSLTETIDIVASMDYPEWYHKFITEVYQKP